MGFGPLVPFLSHRWGRDQNDYALFMITGSVLYIVATVLLKIIEDRISYHQGIIFGYVVMGVASIGF